MNFRCIVRYLVHDSRTKRINMPIRLLLCFFLLFPLWIHAQSLLFKAGANFGMLKEQTFGFHTGVAGHMRINEKVFLQPELCYLNQNHKENNSRFSYHYLLMPLTFHFEIDPVRFIAGGQMGSLIEASSKDLSKDTKNYINGNLKTFELALVAGFTVPVERFTLDVRYNHGITNTAKNLGTANKKSFNRMILFSILYPLIK